MIIGEAFDEHIQIDRACAAQSSEMLPKPKADDDEVVKARERIERHKAQAKQNKDV